MIEYETKVNNSHRNDIIRAWKDIRAPDKCSRAQESDPSLRRN
jgi:hypothetical protein